MLRNKLKNLDGPEEPDHLDFAEEEQKVSKKSKKKNKKRKKKDTPSKTQEHIDIVGSLTTYINSESNTTHKLLIDVLKPIAF